MTTAVTPLAGTPAVPVTWRLIVPPAPTSWGTPVPLRVSMIRVGVSGLSVPVEGTTGWVTVTSLAFT